MTTLAPKPCVRGCTRARRHVTDCEDREECYGCEPRPVHQDGSRLCEPCHLRLSATLAEAPGQYALLLATAAPSQQLSVRPQNRHPLPSGWRTETTSADGQTVDPPPVRMHAPQSVSAPQEREPVRLACHDTASDLADLLSQWVEWLSDHYRTTMPTRRSSLAERDGVSRKVWRGWAGGYVLTEPPVRFEVTTAARWLRGNLGRLEALEPIGDEVEALGAVMGRAHALTPWREQSKRMRGIPCPECQRPTLVQYGGRDTVTCTTRWCTTEIAQGRYLIWARQYEEEAG